MKRVKNPVLNIILLASFSLFFSSCTEILQGQTTKKTTVAKDNRGEQVKTTTTTTQKGILSSKKPPVKYRIDDLPVPDRYKFNEDKSFVFETETIRTGILIYNGGSDITKVIDFYKEEMPKHGWSMIHMFQHKDATMLFQKENWICTVKLEGSWSSNVLSLTIAPKDPGSAPPPNK